MVSSIATAFLDRGYRPPRIAVMLGIHTADERVAGQVMANSRAESSESRALAETRSISMLVYGGTGLAVQNNPIVVRSSLRGQFVSDPQFFVRL